VVVVDVRVFTKAVAVKKHNPIPTIVHNLKIKHANNKLNIIKKHDISNSLTVFAREISSLIYYQ
jgi:hypothetical protein